MNCCQRRLFSSSYLFRPSRSSSAHVHILSQKTSHYGSIPRILDPIPHSNNIPFAWTTINPTPRKGATPQYSRSISSSDRQLYPSFHGLSLPEESDEPSPPSSSKIKIKVRMNVDDNGNDIGAKNINGENGENVQEAEIINSKQYQQQLRDQMVEVARAEMLAYRQHDNSQQKHQHPNDQAGQQRQDIFESTAADDASRDSLSTASASLLGTYERRMDQLQSLQKRHQDLFHDDIEGSSSSSVWTYQKSMSHRQLGELQYLLGQMEQSQTNFMSALKGLLELDFAKHDDDNDDGDDDGCEENYNYNLLLDEDSDRMANEQHSAFQRKLIMAQIMHSIGAIHARCGEYHEARRWYDESLKRKQQLLCGNADGSGTFHHYELGKTYNGQAALEIMMTGTNARSEKAMKLFEQAELHYLHHFDDNHADDHVQQQEGDSNSLSPLQTATSKTQLQTEARIQITKMTAQHAQSLINVRSNMGELLRQRKSYDDAIIKYQSALELARLDVERIDKNNNPTVLSEEAQGIWNDINDPSDEERRNAVVDLLVNIADCHVSNDNYDAAAEIYEQALENHLLFRSYNKNTSGHHDQTREKNKDDENGKELLPVTIDNTNNNNTDQTDNGTAMEAAIRSNLAHSLAYIGRHELALTHYEASLRIKRQIGGDLHLEVGHTLIGMGALLAGPMRDYTRSLNCFKEALHIYRCNLDDIADNRLSNGSGNKFYDGEDEGADMIDQHVQNAMKNIKLVEAALMKKS